MDSAVEAARDFLYAAVGKDETIQIGRLWHDLVIREAAAMFPEDGTFNDELARDLNEALAAHGAPYRLRKGWHERRKSSPVRESEFVPLLFAIEQQAAIPAGGERDVRFSGSTDRRNRRPYQESMPN